MPSEAQVGLPTTERDGEEAAGQDSVELQGEYASESAAGPPPGGEADTKEAAYARMQALLAERNGMPSPQSPSAAPGPQQPFSAGKLWFVTQITGTRVTTSHIG